VKSTPFYDNDEPEVQPTAVPVIIDPPPQPRPPAPTAREQYVRQRTSWDDQIDATYSEMAMRAMAKAVRTPRSIARASKSSNDCAIWRATSTPVGKIEKVLYFVSISLNTLALYSSSSFSTVNLNPSR
jgi:hypothetical protein